MVSLKLSRGFSSPLSRPDDSVRTEVLLFVDDEPQIAASLADQFRRRYTVLTAPNGPEALRILSQSRVSVIVADQRMPGMTGSELLAKAATMAPETTRILMTGYADIAAVIDAVNEGRIFFYLTKPWEPDKLEAVITRATEHNRLITEMNRLVEELRVTNSQLQAMNATLEQRVSQRTQELEEANRRISELAYNDPLTGLANRRSLDKALASEANRCARLNLPLTVIIMDVDHFKHINDEFGHPVGDRVLVQLARFLTQQIRLYDLAARLGGEEFMILLSGASLSQGGEVAERFRAGIAALTIEGVPRQVTASFGVATLAPGSQHETLFERADKALYRAKSNGRNCVELEKGEWP